MNSTSEAGVRAHPDSHGDDDNGSDELDSEYGSSGAYRRATRKRARRNARRYHPDRDASRQTHPAVHFHFDDRDDDGAT